MGMAAGTRAKRASGGAVAVAAALVAALLLLFAATADAAMVCSVDQSALETCRPYCARGSGESRPSPGCCAAVLNADFKCFCRYKGLLRAYRLDPARAMQIPAMCQLDGATANPCG